MQIPIAQQLVDHARGIAQDLAIMAENMERALESYQERESTIDVADAVSMHDALRDVAFNDSAWSDDVNDAADRFAAAVKASGADLIGIRRAKLERLLRQVEALKREIDTDTDADEG